mgnify:CR=1 FL=1
MPVNFISQSQINRLKELAKGGEATIYDYKTIARHEILCNRGKNH